MRHFITSDIHFFHANILQYCVDSRGHFSDVNHMNQTIINNINSMVTDEDVLIIAGDIGFGGDMGKVADCLKQINGQKIMVWGNHDKRFRKSPEFEFQKASIGVIHECDYLEQTIKDADTGRKYDFVIGHFPFLTWNGAHHGVSNLHGHSHSPKEKKNTQGNDIRQMDIGLDGNDLMPYDMIDLGKEMSKRQKQSHGHHKPGQAY